MSKRLIVMLLMLSVSFFTNAAHSCFNNIGDHKCKCSLDTCSITGSKIENASFNHIHWGVDYQIDGKTKGCSSCGASANPSEVSPLTFNRFHRFRNSTEESSFGPGIYSNWSTYLYYR